MGRCRAEWRIEAAAQAIIRDISPESYSLFSLGSAISSKLLSSNAWDSKGLAWINKHNSPLRGKKRLQIFQFFTQKRDYGVGNIRKLLTQSTMLSSAKGLALSIGRRPVINSKSTTPKEKTSDFSVSFPLEAYSGAKYLIQMFYKSVKWKWQFKSENFLQNRYNEVLLARMCPLRGWIHEYLCLQQALQGQNLQPGIQ